MYSTQVIHSGDCDVNGNDDDNIDGTSNIDDMRFFVVEMKTHAYSWKEV